MGRPEDYRPAENAPFLDKAPLLPTTPADMEGRPRRPPVNPGPWEHAGQLRAIITPSQSAPPAPGKAAGQSR